MASLPHPIAQALAPIALPKSEVRLSPYDTHKNSRPWLTEGTPEYEALIAYEQKLSRAANPGLWP